jgi:D-alanyl-D-alanine carboxypeptidase
MIRVTSVLCIVAVSMIVICTPYPASAQSGLPSDLQQKIDTLVITSLAKSGVPSASVAVVKNGRIAFLKAYGNARTEPRIEATTEMRYSIGSISKQFTATAILLLQEEGKLSLDDRVAKFIPDLTRAADVSIRQLLSHTSGYQDYWPQDYVMKPMLQPTMARNIMDEWAHKPLDFEPGTRWQYSNTNYVIAGAIVEKAAGKPLLQFLHERIFDPLGMSSVSNIDDEQLDEKDPTGYMRYALGPLRPAPKEGRGWLFAAGELAMTAKDLATWDVSIIAQKILKPSSYEQLETEVLLKNGVGSRYGLGVDVGTDAGHHTIAHGGEVSGFTSANIVLPEDSAAIVVLTNQDAASASGIIAHGIIPLMFAAVDSTAAKKTAQAISIFEGLQDGTIDRKLFTENANNYFGEQALKDFSSSLAPLGSPKEFMQVGTSLRGGMTLRRYRIRFANKTLTAWTFELPDGELEQYQVAE